MGPTKTGNRLYFADLWIALLGKMLTASLPGPLGGEPSSSMDEPQAALWTSKWRPHDGGFMEKDAWDRLPSKTTC